MNTRFRIRSCIKFLALSSLFSIYAQKTLKKHIFTSIWIAQHPNAGGKIQQLLMSKYVPSSVFWLKLVTSPRPSLPPQVFFNLCSCVLKLTGFIFSADVVEESPEHSIFTQGTLVLRTSFCANPFVSTIVALLQLQDNIVKTVRRYLKDTFLFLLNFVNA